MSVSVHEAAPASVGENVRERNKVVYSRYQAPSDLRL